MHLLLLLFFSPCHELIFFIRVGSEHLFFWLLFPRERRFEVFSPTWFFKSIFFFWFWKYIRMFSFKIPYPPHTHFSLSFLVWTNCWLPASLSWAHMCGGSLGQREFVTLLTSVLCKWNWPLRNANTKPQPFLYQRIRGLDHISKPGEACWAWIC